MRYLLDENLPEKAAALLRERGYEAEHVRPPGREGMSDEAQLDFAAAAGYVIVTRHYDDFPGLAARSYHEAHPHGGVLMLPPPIEKHDLAGIAAAIELFELSRS